MKYIILAEKSIQSMPWNNLDQIVQVQFQLLSFEFLSISMLRATILRKYSHHNVIFNVFHH